jgi:hypothetical protein
VVPRVFAAHEEVVRIPDVGHVGLLFSPQALRIVADRLLEDPAESRRDPDQLPGRAARAAAAGSEA